MNWTPDSITELATGYWKSATLMAGVELGVFDALEQPQTLEQLAGQLDVRVPLLAALLDGLCGLAVLEKSGAAYQLAPSARPLLSRSSPTCMLDALRYNVDLFKQWQHLPKVIRTGEPAIPQVNHLGMDAALTRRFVRGMEAKARAYSPTIAPCIDLSDKQRLLDVGCGPGTLSRLLAEQHPQLRATLLDLPEVIALARQICETSPAAERLTFVPSNYRTHILPDDFDAILFAGALHQETVASAGDLVQKFHAALRPGGIVYIVDLMVDATRTAPVLSTLFQLSMMLCAPSAHVFSDAELDDMLKRTGFEQFAIRQPTSGPYRIVAARRI